MSKESVNSSTSHRTDIMKKKRVNIMIYISNSKKVDMNAARQKIIIVLTVLAIILPGRLHAERQRVWLYSIAPNEIAMYVKSGAIEILTQKPGEYLDCLADRACVNELRTQGARIEVLVADLDEHYRRLLKDCRSTFGAYYTYAEAVAELNSIHAAFPTITSPPESIGVSRQGRIIWAIKVSSSPISNNGKPGVMYTGVHHAREPIGCSICLGLASHFCRQYGSDPLATWLVDNRQLWFVPVVNPDGYVYNETDPSGIWRKNRRDNGGGVFGVDLNRNYPYMWGYNDTGSSPDSINEVYRGPAPGSEPEVKAVMDLAIRERCFKTCIHYHSSGNNFGHAWSYDNTANPDSLVFEDLDQEISLLNGYPSSQGTGPNGDVRDWFYGEQTIKPKCFSYLFEVGDDFWQAVSDTTKIVQQFGQNLLPALVAAQAAGPYLTRTGLPVISGGNGNNIMEPGETVSLAESLKNKSMEQPLTGVHAALSSDDAYLDILQASTDQGSFEARQSKTGQPFIIRSDSQCPAGHYAVMQSRYAADNGYESGESLKLAIGPPVSNVLFADSVRNGTVNWTHGGNNDLWHISPQDAHSPVQSWYCGIEGSWQYRDTMNCRLVSQPISAARFSYLEFWHRYDLETDYDFGYVEISLNDGASWQQLGPRFTGHEGWTKRTIDLSSYGGTAQLGFRMYTDISVHDYEGWYVDDILVTGTNDNNRPPERPVCQWPVGGTVLTDSPVLTVNACQDPDGNPVHYGFKIYTDSLLTVIWGKIDSSNTDTIWQVSPPLTSGRYWWRAYADDGKIRSNCSAPANFYYDPAGVQTQRPANTIPWQAYLRAGYPNPACRSTIIRYGLTATEKMELNIYNVAGQLVRTLSDGRQEAGNHESAWDLRDNNGRNVGSGVFICRLRTLDFTGSQKIVVVKGGFK